MTDTATIEPKPGWLYCTDLWHHDQSYGWCVPVSTSKGWYMQDTYQLSCPYRLHDGESKHDAAIRRAIELSDGEDHMWTINHCRGSYYHCASAPFNAHDFEPVCNLNEYRYVDHEESQQYEDNNVIDGVKLYFEHGYSWTWGSVGIALVRKDAQKSDIMTFRRNLRHVSSGQTYPSASFMVDYYIGNVPDNLPDEDRLEYEQILEINELLKKQEQEINAVFKKYKRKKYEIEERTK